MRRMRSLINRIELLPDWLPNQSNFHLSASLKTMSMEPRMAEQSASMCPRLGKSMACRRAKPGARILHLQGLLVPSETTHLQCERRIRQAFLFEEVFDLG